MTAFNCLPPIPHLPDIVFIKFELEAVEFERAQKQCPNCTIYLEYAFVYPSLGHTSFSPQMMDSGMTRTSQAEV